MKGRLLPLLLLAIPAASAAEEHPAEPDGVRVGVGLPIEVASSLGLLGYLGYMEETERYELLFDTADIRVPILTPGVRIEPEIGISRWAFEEGEDPYSSLKLATSVAKSWTVGPKGSAYAGGRLGVLRYAQGEEKQSDLFLGAVAGGEVWPTRSFSFGGEVSLDYVRFHEDMNWIHTAIATRAALIARFYFN